MQNLHIIDIAIVISYLVICLIIGFVTSSKIKNMKDYAIGGSYVPTVMLVGTLIATDIGAGATVGTIEKVHSMGLLFAIAILFKPVFWIIAAKLFSKRIAYFRSVGCISVSDIIETLYGKTARWITNFMALAISIGILALQISAMGYLFQYFFELSPAHCSLLAFTVLVTYSFFGGIRAIIFTDVMQAGIFFIGIPMACFMAYADLNMNYAQIIEHLPISHKTIDWSAANGILFASLVFHSIIAICDGPLIQRYLMASNEMQMKKVMRYCFVLSVPFALIICAVGFITQVASPDINPNLAFFHLVNTYLPVGAKGFLIAGILAAIMSTADSWLNTASVLCAHDIFKKILPSSSGKKEVLIARLSLLSIAGIAAFIALGKNESVFAPWIVVSFWSPIILIPMCAGFLKFKTNATSFLLSAITATTCVLAGKIFAGEFGTISMMLGIIGSALGLFGGHYIQTKLGHIQSSGAPQKSFVLNYILKFSKKSVIEHGRTYYIASVVGFLCFLNGLFLSGFGHTTFIINLYFFSALMCFLLALHEYILTPAQQDKYLPLYFHLTVFVTFALNPLYCLINSSFDIMWVMHIILSAFIIYLLCGFKATAIILSLGLISAQILIISLNEYIAGEHAPTYLSTIILGICTASVAALREKFQRSAIEQREHYAKMMAHQLMQPISQISMVAEHLNHIFSGYKDTTKSQDDMEYFMVAKDDLLEAQRVISGFKDSNKANEKTVRGLLTVMRDDIEKAHDIGVYDIAQCVNEALSIYCHKERNRIEFKTDNSFLIKASKMFIVEAIRNIVSNSFKYAGKNAVINIWMEHQTLYIKDNGVGIKPEFIDRIFDHAYNADGKTEGTGLGLAFCKKVMDVFGNNIECKSEIGKYSKFSLKFARH